MENSESISKKIRKKQEEIDEELSKLEEYLASKKFKKLFLLLHPKIRKRIQELERQNKKLYQEAQENMDLIHLEALLESKELYGRELLLAEKELDDLKNFEKYLKDRENTEWFITINNYLKRKYGLSLFNPIIVSSGLVRLALKYNVGIKNREKAEKMFYDFLNMTFIKFAPYYEWGLEFNRRKIIEALIEKIKQTIQKLQIKIEEIDSVIN